LIEDGISVIQELTEEMESWRDNMDSGNMTHMPKYEEVGECVDALEQADSDAESSDWAERLGEALTKVTVPSYQEMRPYGKGSMSRAMRLSNGVAALEAAISFLQEQEPEGGWPEVTGNEDPQGVIDDLQNVVDTLQGVNFPGMY
jgi:hypothetical protein